MPPGSFPTTLLLAGLDYWPHTISKMLVSRASGPSFSHYALRRTLRSAALLCAALHPPLCAAPPSPAVRSLAPSLPPTRRPPPSFCILRYDVVSSARPSSFQLPGRRFRYVSIHSYILSAQPGKRDHCERLRKGNGQVLKMAWRFVAHG